MTKTFKDLAKSKKLVRVKKLNLTKSDFVKTKASNENFRIDFLIL